MDKTIPTTINTKEMPDKVFAVANEYLLSPTKLINWCVMAQYGTPTQKKQAKALLKFYK